MYIHIFNYDIFKKNKKKKDTWNDSDHFILEYI